MNNKILEIRSLNKSFVLSKSFLGKPESVIKAVDDVSFNIVEGEVLGLVGESGCGKSTIGKLIMRLISPDSGLINVNGKNIYNLSKKELFDYRKYVQIIFQDPYASLNPRINVENTLREVLFFHFKYSNIEIQKRIKELLGYVGMSSDVLKKYPHEFSGGQRQRIVIARALALNPSFIVADEPVSALDVSIQAQILNLLIDLKSELNLSFLFISHDLSVVRYFSDRIIVMKAGRIVEKGNTEEIYKSPQHEYTKLLLNSVIR